MDNLSNLRQTLWSYADPVKAVLYPRFFKTGKGQYGEGDQFIGVTVPKIKAVATQFADLTLDEVFKLLSSPVHEERWAALMILTRQFTKGDAQKKEKIYTRYLKNTRFINNWDLVDASAPAIVGGYLSDKKDRSILYGLAKSPNLFERRIAILSTFYFINKQKEYQDTFEISKLLLNDKHDLIHKAVGWMLREVGKRISEKKVEEFLKGDYKKIPRTTLRYAIERFPPQKRSAYLKRQF